MPTPIGEQLGYITVSIRKKLKLVLLVIVLGMMISFPFLNDLLIIIKDDLLPEGAELIYISPVEVILLKFKMALAIGVLLSLPVILYIMHRALKERFKIRTRIKPSNAVLFLVTAISLFVIGMIYSYCFMLPLFLKFLYSDATGSGLVHATYSIQEFVSFVLIMTLLIGISFELPLLILFFVRSGLVRLETVKAYRRHAYVALFIMAAVFTPPDVFSQIIVGLPLVIFYEAGILIAGIGYSPTAKNRYTFKHDP
ncbi:MAG: Sec-independent protein translocase protein tatC [Candidatus Syntrophoarchaeum caldarius]|uniref:Sec-independent protein translocase protein TatC n=1 Tax=Candidatus Syntropharchaeum caldarium TaxID=1838285 RepID=A0A1F2PBU8_9EURY|nr:MAG: Sec-independent protein translocase protein tatC [Candidatus Syntrophoarchaeum caldarius]